jgi:hypothetical protein
MNIPPDSALAYSGPSVDAQRAWSALRGQGIEAQLLDQTLGNLYGTGSVLVVVPERQREAAWQLLVELGIVVEARGQ